MTIVDIIGKGKDFEPPFKVIEILNRPHPIIVDANERRVCSGVTNKSIANHIVKLLNREHDKRRRMCLRNRTKVCDLCHECDIDVLNPGDLFAGY